MKNTTLLDKQFATYDAESWSESDTRSKFIDYILHEICGIPESAIRREFHASDLGYLDYLVIADPFKVVVEAKRAKVDLVGGRIKSGPTKLGHLFSANKKLREHVDQVTSYAVRKGCLFAVLTNGRQWLLFEPYRPNTEQDDIPAIVYCDIVGRDKTYSPAWLSKVLGLEGIQKREFLRQLGDRGQVASLPPIINDLDNSTIEERDLERELRSYLQMYFRDAGFEMSQELLRKSWVNPALPSIRDATFGVKYTPNQVATLLDTRKGVKSFAEMLNGINAAKEESSKVVPLIGEPGTGKTHFLRLTMSEDENALVLDSDRADIPRSAQVQKLWIYIDLRFLNNVPRTQVEQRIFDELLTRLHVLDGKEVNEHVVDVGAKETVRSMFPSAFAKFSDPLWKQLSKSNSLEYAQELDKAHESCKARPAKYLAALLRHLVEYHHLWVRLVCDNADQLDAEVQKDIYLFVQSLAIKSKTALVVALRESWYSRHKTGEAASAFSDFVYALAPVPVIDVLSRRIELVEAELVSDAKRESLGYFFLRSLRQSIANNKEVGELYEGLSNDSARRGLGLISKTTRSAYLNVKDLWWAKQDDKKSFFNFRLHQLLPAIVGGRHAYYDPSEYPIPNVFVTQTSSGVDHWFRLQALSALESYYSTRAQQKSRGYAPRQMFVQALVLATMHSEREVESCLQQMDREGVISFDVRRISEEEVLESWTRVRISTMGRYLLREAGRVSYTYCMLPLIPLKRMGDFRDKVRSAFKSAESASVSTRSILIRDFISYLAEDAGLSNENSATPRNTESIDVPAPIALLEMVKDRAENDIKEIDTSMRRAALR